MRLTRIPRSIWQWLRMPFQWLFVRLPWSFSLPWLFITALYFAFAFPLLAGLIGSGYLALINRIFNAISQEVRANLGMILGSVASFVVSLVTVAPSAIVLSVITLALAYFGVLCSYWVAGKFYSKYREYRAFFTKPIEAPIPVRPVMRTDETRDEADQDEASKSNPLASYKRIGIILSGGGAKGAYQAGAMQAIYEFLEEHNAHHKVKMIAATSIGSWNALFWLAGLIKSANGGPAR